MAVYCRGVIGECYQGETNEEFLQFMMEIGADEAQTLTIRKPSKTTYAAPAAGSAVTEEDDAGTVARLSLKAADVDEAGPLFIKSAGATHTSYAVVNVKEAKEEPSAYFSALAIDRSGRVVAKSEVHRRIDRAK